MKLKLNAMPPAIIIKTEFSMKKRNRIGWAIGPLAAIHPEHISDSGLLAHELYHVSQWWATTVVVFIVGFVLALILDLIHLPLSSDLTYTLLGLGIAAVLAMPILYKLSDDFRLHTEVAAYRVQLETNHYPFNGKPIEYFYTLYAHFISSNYGLPVSFDEALELLEEQ